MSKVKNEYHDEIEQRALFALESDASEDDAFEILDAAGIGEITWSKSLNNDYAQWQYFNLK